jgi:hypothetical protein
MATFQTQSTTGTAITVVYPAEKRPALGSIIQFRIGKKTVQPAYNHANLPHLVEFQIGQRTVMLMLGDILESSYWQRIRNAYTWLGQLEVDHDVRLEADAAAQLALWLKAQLTEVGEPVAAMA